MHHNHAYGTLVDGGLIKELDLMGLIGHVNNIPKMQFFTGISGNTQSKSYYAVIDRVCLGFPK